MRAFPLCTFLVLAACVDSDPSSDDDVDTGTADVGEDTDTDTDTGVEPEPVDDIAGDTCATADILGTGSWEVTGSLAGMGNNYNSTCTMGAPGRDAAVQVSLEAGEYLYARYGLQDGDGVMYALESCAAPNACDDWADEDGVEELVLMPSDVARERTLILDATDLAAEGEYTLQLDISSPATLDHNDACDAAPVAQGVHNVLFNRARNDADLAWASASCTGVPKSAGLDTRVPVDVPAGATLSATWISHDADGVLYLLSECGNVDSCVAGSDRSTYGDPERVRWTNDTGSDQRMTLILDAYSSGSGAAGGTLSVHVF